MKNEAHLLLTKHLEELGLFAEREAGVNLQRKWRWDFLIPERQTVIDIQGGTWISGKHTRGAGYQNDCDKANDAVSKGWRVLRFTTADVLKGRAKKFIEENVQ